MPSVRSRLDYRPAVRVQFLDGRSVCVACCGGLCVEFADPFFAVGAQRREQVVRGLRLRSLKRAEVVLGRRDRTVDLRKDGLGCGRSGAVRSCRGVEIESNVNGRREYLSAAISDGYAIESKGARGSRLGELVQPVLATSPDLAPTSPGRAETTSPLAPSLRGRGRGRESRYIGTARWGELERLANRGVVG